MKFQTNRDEKPIWIRLFQTWRRTRTVVVLKIRYVYSKNNYRESHTHSKLNESRSKGNYYENSRTNRDGKSGAETFKACFSAHLNEFSYSNRKWRKPSSVRISRHLNEFFPISNVRSLTICYLRDFHGSGWRDEKTTPAVDGVTTDASEQKKIFSKRENEKSNELCIYEFRKNRGGKHFSV